MKKLTLFLAAALLAASFAACGNSGASSSTAPEPTAIPDDILNAPATKPDPDMEIDPGFGVDPEDSNAAQDVLEESIIRRHNLVRLEDVEEPQDEGDLEGDEVWSD